MVTTSYPGVYIDEFAPASPIQGVSTSVAAFIGLTERGPVGVPTRIQSLDDFTRRFGAHVQTAPVRHLPLSVAGFFRNGGTDCYIVRVSNAQAAEAQLADAGGVGTTLVATATAEGAAGAAVSVKVTESSRLGDALTAAGAGSTKLKVATIAAMSVVTFPTGAAPQARRQLTGNAGDAANLALLEVGDTVTLTDTGGTNTATAQVAQVTGLTVRFAAPVAGAIDFTGGTFTLSAPAAGDTSIRVTVPAGLRLATAVPLGTQLRIDDGTSNEAVTVAGVTGSTISVARALANSYAAASAEVASEEWDLEVSDPSGLVETFPQLSMNAAHPRYWRTQVSSTLITLGDPAVPLAASSDPRPAAVTTNLAGGTDDDPVASAALLTADLAASLDLLAPIDIVSLVAVPGVTDSASQKAIVAHCEAMRDRFAILDAGLGLDTDAVIAQRQGVTGDNLGFAALYHPWITITDPVTRTTPLWPPSAHMAGVYARTDALRGVHKAPANALIVGALDLERRLTDQMQGPLNLEGVNVIRLLPGMGSPVVWGARTTTTENRNWQYVNIRRLFLYLEESIAEGIRNSVFEPNDLALWERLKRTITEFLTRVWRDGALFGATAKDAFYVRIDEALNPPSTRKLGQLYIEIGVQPTYPAEFIIVRIGIWDGGAQVSES